jgi:hypothetical protein
VLKIKFSQNGESKHGFPKSHAALIISADFFHKQELSLRISQRRRCGGKIDRGIVQITAY